MKKYYLVYKCSFDSDFDSHNSIYILGIYNNEDKAKENEGYEQMELFTDYTMADEKKSAMDEKIKKERKLQEAMLSVKKRYGKNAMLKGMNLEEGATAIQRNNQIGGHRA